MVIPSVKAISSDINNPSENEIAYDRTPTKGVYQMMKLINLVKKRLGDIKQPVLIFKSSQDHVVPVESATYTLENLGSKNKDLVWLENSFHVATQDYDKDIIFKESLKFIKKLS